MPRPPASKRKSAAAPASSSLAMIWVNGRRIRRRITRQYEKALRDLNVTRQQLDRFQNGDVPVYRRWINGEFGALLTEVRETTARLAELDSIFLEVHEEILFSGLPPSQAYARVMHRRKNPRSRQGGFDDSEDDPFGDGQEENERRSSNARDRCEEQGSDFDEFSEFGGGKRAAGRAPNSSNPVNASIKELYRALARRLHPDAQKEMSAQKKEWWHETQAAYERGDAEHLEHLLSRCEIEEAGNVEKTSLSGLQRLIAQLKRSIRQLKSQLAHCRRDPAWGFEARLDKEAVAATIRQQLTYDLKVMKERLREMEARIADWTAAKGRSSSVPRRRSARPDPVENFF